MSTPFQLAAERLPPHSAGGSEGTLQAATHDLSAFRTAVTV